MTERVNRKYDKPTGEMVIKKKNLRELRSELAAARGHIDVNLIKGSREKIALLSLSAGIALEKTIKKVIRGWVGQSKGMLQVVFERGGIDPTKFDPRAKHGKQDYTVGGKKDAFGNLDKEPSPRQKIERMPDFVSEETLLQYHAQKLGS